MSVNWNWNGKCGEVSVKQMHPKEADREFTISLYNGNCMVVMLYEYKDEQTGEDMYNLFSFFADKDHAKNCLGLSKGTNNIFDTPYQRFTKVRLNKKKCRYFKDLVALFAQAFDNIDIEVYTE